MAIDIRDEIRKRILVLDGGLGTEVQGFDLKEEDYRGNVFTETDVPLKGCNDALVLTRPYDVIGPIHEVYLAAGADIISTCTFNANRISLSDYKIEDYVYEINRKGAELARKYADKFTDEDPDKPRFVAGSIGPSNQAASISPDLFNPAMRTIDFEGLCLAFEDQVKGLIDGGVDVFLVETAIDPLNTKAVLYLIDKLCDERGVDIPVMVSGTLTDASGRLLTGQTIDAYYAAVSRTRLLSIGLNCGLGAEQLGYYVAKLSDIATCAVSAHPNAGLPNGCGGYDETPEMMAEALEKYLKRGLLNIVGGCCGTTPYHIQAIANVVSKYKPRELPVKPGLLTLSGLETLSVPYDTHLVVVGDGSDTGQNLKFAALLTDKNFESAVGIASTEIGKGAQMVQVYLDANQPKESVREYFNFFMADPSAAKVPLYIRTQKPEQRYYALSTVQGKSLAGNVSLRKGDDDFLSEVKEILALGAVPVVEAVDESGKADSYPKATGILSRAYDLLSAEGIPAENFVFDVGVSSVTAMSENQLDFIHTTRFVKANYPGVKTIGQMSALVNELEMKPFARQALLTVFTCYAHAQGLDIAVVTPDAICRFDAIPSSLLQVCEELIQGERSALDELLGMQNASTPTADLGQIVEKALTAGISSEELLEQQLPAFLQDIGVQFSEGHLWVPQLTELGKSMQQALGKIKAALTIPADKKGKILLATVNNCAPDAGKALLNLYLTDKGYEIKDLGTVTDPRRIIDQAVSWGADAIELSLPVIYRGEEILRIIQYARESQVCLPIVLSDLSQVHQAHELELGYGGKLIYTDNIRENDLTLQKIITPAEK